ncbi:MAG: O-antigen ligase family protein, partial [Gemmataceae bacterium]
MATLVVRPGGLSADRYLRAGLEAVVLALVVATPWALGAVEPLFFRFVLAGVAVLLLLWSARLVVTGELRWRSCPGTLGLTGLFVLTLIQLIPLPSSVLSVAAPETRSLLHDLLPTVPETLPGDVPSAAAADRPLSLYSGATRDFLIQILAVFLIYVVVRQQLASAATLRRLAWACLLNGVALALFALCQAFSSPPNVVYGAFRVDGAVFGPFICRNHFPFYMHLCIGLGVGLLRPESPPDKRRARPRGSFEPGEVLAALQSPRALGVLLALGLMLAASAYSLSRGGVLAQFAALVISAGVWWRSKVQPRGWLGAAAAAVLLAMLLGAWFGLTPLEDRLATLADSDQLNNSRGQLWRNVLPLARRFPLVGTGNGTFAFVEPMTRDQPRTGVMFVHEFAHNEYLEALIEGGVIRLG